MKMNKNGKKNINLLILDDSEEFVFLMTSFLNIHEIEVESVSDPELALRKVKSKKFDLVITDYLMDEMDGINFSKEALALESDLKIILLTAKALDEDELIEVKKLGLSYVMKPILPDELYEKILETIDP